MNPSLYKTLRWTPRILGLLMALFIAVFALDAFSAEGTFLQKLGGFLIHLIPTYLMLIAVYLGWRWKLPGGLIFLAWAVWYALVSLGSGIDPVTFLVISGIPALVGLMFIADWYMNRRAA